MLRRQIRKHGFNLSKRSCRNNLDCPNSWGHHDLMFINPAAMSGKGILFDKLNEINKLTEEIKTQENLNNEQGGEGLLSNILRSGLDTITSGTLATKLKNIIPSSDETARPAFKGEKHAILKLPNGRMGIASYMGPGTAIGERLKRGDPPRTESDKVAQAHDIRYLKAQNVDDVREADRIMLRKLREIARANKDSPFNIRQGNLIAAKIKAEDVGLIKRDAFSGKLPYKIPADVDRIATQKLKELAQLGYGHPTQIMGIGELREEKNGDEEELMLPGDKLKIKLLKKLSKSKKKKVMV